MFKKDSLPKKQDLLTILLFFGKKIGLEINILLAMQCIEQAEREFNELNWENFPDWLKFLGEKFGIIFSLHKESLSSAITFSNPKHPKVSLMVFGSHSDWFAIQGDSLRGVRLVFLSHPNKEIYYPKQKLKTRLSETSDSELFVFITGEPVYSFSVSSDSNEPSSYLDRIQSLIRLELNDIWIIVVYSIAIVILSLVIPIGTQSLVNILAFGTVYQPIIVLTLLVLIALGFAGIMGILQAHVAEILQQRLFVRLATEVSHKLPRVEYSYFDKKSGGDLVNYFLDISILLKGAVILLVDGLGLTLQMIIGLLVLIIYHPFFIIFDILIVSIIIIVVFKILGKEAVETSVKESKYKHQLTTWFEELAFNRHNFKSEYAQRYATLKSDSIAEKYLDYRKKHFKILIRQVSVLILLQVLGNGLILGVGGWLVITGGLSLGQLIAAEIISTKILDSLAKAGKYLETYYDLCAALDKIGQLLAIPLEKKGLEIVPKLETPASIHISNLTLSVGQENLFIKDLKIFSSEIVGIQTNNPRKASALLSLLYGLKEINSGVVEIDERFSFSEISKINWRNQVSLVRGYKLFSGTILENLTQGNPKLNAGEIRLALKKVKVLDDIAKLRDGIHHELNSKGYPLVPEQAFRINLAKCLLNQPRLILIDEVLDFLEEDFSLYFINEILKKEMKKTTLIYSKKDFILQACERIITL